MKCINSVIIDKPKAEVWVYFLNPENMPKWLTGFVRLEHVSGTPGTVGARA